VGRRRVVTMKSEAKESVVTAEFSAVAVRSAPETKPLISFPCDKGVDD
jgi:hypothetical protein